MNCCVYILGQQIHHMNVFFDEYELKLVKHSGCNCKLHSETIDTF